MSLTKEDLQSIGELMDAKLEKFGAQIDARFDRLEKRMESLEKRVESLEKRVESLEKRMDALENRVSALEVQFNEFKVILENDMLPRLRHMEQCYLSTFESYREKADRIDAIEMDVDILKKVVADHSQQLQKLA